MAVSDFKALQKWAKIPKNIQQIMEIYGTI